MSCGGGTNTVTQQANPPPQFLDAYTKLVQAGQAQAQSPLQQYGGPLVAGFTPQQQQAFSTIQNAQGIAQPYINAGAGLIGQSAAPISANGLITGDQLSGLAQRGLGYTNSAANTGIAAAGQPGISSAMGAAGTPIQQFGADTLGKYLNPYLGGQVAATQAEFDNQNAQTAQGITSNAIKSGAFGGDRADVAQGIARGQEQLAQAPVIAGLESNAYQQATGLFTQQQQEQLAQQQLESQTGLGAAGLQQQAAGQQGQLGLSAAQQLYGLFGGQQQTGLAAAQASGWLGENAGAMTAGLGSQAENTALTGASANLQAGQQQQGLAQEQLNIPYEQFLARQAYPYQNLQFLAGLTTGAGSNAGGQSSTTSPGPSTLSQIGGAGLAGVGLLGATGAFGSSGYLSGLGSAVAGLFKRGGTVGYDAGGTIPDVSVSYVPDLKATRGGGPPKAPNATAQEDPLAQGLASMKDANSLKGLFAGSSDPALAGKLAGIGATWNSILASPETAGDFLAAKFGGRAGYAFGGNPQDPAEGQNPIVQASFSRFAGMPEEQLRELSVRMPAGSAQGDMIRRALQQKQMMPANDNNLGLAATGTYGPVTGLASGGVPGMSFIPGARGVSIPQIDSTMFAPATGLDAGGGLSGWYNPLPQLQPPGSAGPASGSPTITTPMPKSILDVFAPPPPSGVSVSTNSPDVGGNGKDAGGSSDSGGGGPGGGSNSGGGGSAGTSSSSSSSGTGPGSNSSHWGSTLGTAGGLAGLASGAVGLGLAGNALGTAMDVSDMNKDMERIGAPAMGLGAGLSAFANNATFGMFGRSLDDTFADTNLSGTRATAGLNTNDPNAPDSPNASGGLNGVGESAAGADGYGNDTRDDGDRENGREGFGGGTSGGTAEGGDRESGREGFGGNGHESSDSEGGDKFGGRIGLAAGGFDDDDDQQGLAAAMPSGGVADTQPATPDAHDAVTVRGADDESRPQLASAQTSLAPPSNIDATGLAAANPPSPTKREEYTPGKPSPWMALLTAGAGAMAGRSPYALSNIGQGLLAGAKEYQHENELDSKPEVDHSGETVRIYYPSEKKWIDTGLPTSESMRTKALSADAKARLEQTGAYQAGQQANEKARAEETARHNKADEGLRGDQLAQGKFTAQPVHDAMGNPIGTNIIDNRTGAVRFQGSDAMAQPPASDLTKTGDDFLKTLPADKQGVVKSMIEGRQPPPTSNALAKPYWQQMIQYANQVDPGFDQTSWSGRVATRRAFATGQEAKNVTALNTTLQHAEVLADSFDKLGNTSIPWANAVKNWVATQGGSEAPTNAREAVSAVASEARKVFAGSGGGGLTELENWERNFPLNGSPEQQKGAVKQLVNLMDSRLNALGDQWNRGMTKGDEPTALLSSEAKKSYTKLTGRPPNEVSINNGGGKGGEAAPLAMPSSKDALVPGQTYNTSRGAATWDGTQFLPVK